MPAITPSRRLTAVALAGSLLALTACSNSGSTTGAKASGGATPAANPRTAVVTVTSAKGCTADRQSFPAGPLTFKITNQDATAVTEVELLAGERILGEKENLPPGFSGEFSVNVTAGDYSLYCPGAPTEKKPLKVTGKASGAADSDVAALLKQGTTGYANYINTQLAALVPAVATLDSALHGTTSPRRRTPTSPPGPFYERIEPVAESFVVGKDSIDADIDVRIADDVPSRSGPASTASRTACSGRSR